MTTTDFDLKAYTTLLGFKVKTYNRAFVCQDLTADELCVVVDQLPTEAAEMELNKVYLKKDGGGQYVLKLVQNGPIIPGNIGAFAEAGYDELIGRANNLIENAVTNANQSEWKKVVVNIAAIQQDDFFYIKENEFQGKPIDTITLYNSRANHWECVGETPDPAIQQKLDHLDGLYFGGFWNYGDLNPLREVINQVLRPNKKAENSSEMKKEVPEKKTNKP